MMYGLLRGLMRVIVHLYLVGLYRTVGRELVPRTGPLVVCATHASTIDPPLLPAFLPRSDSWSMAKAEWFARRSFTSWLFTSYHAFPSVRHSPDRRPRTASVGSSPSRMINGLTTRARKKPCGRYVPAIRSQRTLLGRARLA